MAGKLPYKSENSSNFRASRGSPDNEDCIAFPPPGTLGIARLGARSDADSLSCLNIKRDEEFCRAQKFAALVTILWGELKKDDDDIAFEQLY